MKNALLIIKSLVLLSCPLFAVQTKWIASLPDPLDENARINVGIDGSAIVYDRTNSVIYWYDSDGNMQQEVDTLDGYFILDQIIISESSIFLPMIGPGGSAHTTIVRIHTKTDSDYTTKELVGNPLGNDGVLLSYYPYFATTDNSNIIMHVIDEFDQIGGNSNSGISMVPANAIALPASFKGDVNIELQSSDDLIDWTNATPGDYKSIEGPKFFRVKVTTD